MNRSSTYFILFIFLFKNQNHTESIDIKHLDRCTKFEKTIRDFTNVTYEGLIRFVYLSNTYSKTFSSKQEPCQSRCALVRDLKKINKKSAIQVLMVARWSDREGNKLLSVASKVIITRTFWRISFKKPLYCLVLLFLAGWLVLYQKREKTLFNVRLPVGFNFAQ